MPKLQVIFICQKCNTQSPTKKPFLIFFTLLLAIFLFSPIFVFAQEDKSVFDAGVPPTLQTPIPGAPEFSKTTVEGSYLNVPWLAEYIAGIYKYAIALAVSLAIFMVMVGGFLWITAAGDKGKIGKATEIITDAVVGLILAVGSYVILYTINPDLVEFKALQVGVIKRVEFDEASFGDGDASAPFDPTTLEDSSTAEEKDYALYTREPHSTPMLAKCPKDTSDSSKYLDTYKDVIDKWIEELPRKVVYVAGGNMNRGKCEASNRNTYLQKKLSKKGYAEEWMGDLNAYREWAKSLGRIYCGDCLTFSRVLYECVAGINVLPKKENKDVATYFYNTTGEFLKDLNDGKIEMKAGSFIYLAGACGHAINYTGVSGKEIIEMGGGGPPITIKNHKANSVRVQQSLKDYLSTGWIKEKNCPIYVHRPLENPSAYR